MAPYSLFKRTPPRVWIRSWWKIVPIGLVLLLALALTPRTHAQLGSAGDLDSSYGTNGVNTVNFGTSPSFAGAYGVGVQKLGVNAGKMVVAANLVCSAGGVCQEFALMRLNANGTQDMTFGDGGQAVLHVDTNDTMQQNSLVIQSDDKIVIVGFGNTGSGAEKFIVARFTADGQLDTSFAGGTGYFWHQWATASGGINRAQGVTLQDDGKIVAVGATMEQGGDEQCLVVRLNADGTLDTSFNSTGIVEHNFSVGANEQFTAAAISGSGSTRKIVVGGFLPSAGQLLFSRFNNDGSLDTSFGTSGESAFAVGSTVNDRVFGLAIDHTGKILVSGRVVSGHQYMLTARLTSAGALDTTFDSPNGYQTTFVSDGSGTLAVGQTIAEQSDGKIVNGGYDNYSLNNSVSPVQGETDFLFARFNSDGSYDSTFGSGASLPERNPSSGIVLIDSNSGGQFVPTELHAMCLDSSGRAVGVGERSNNSAGVPPDIAAGRLTTGGLLDTTFDSTGYFHAPLLAGTADVAAGMAVDSSGRAIVGGDTTAGGNGNYNLGVARFTASGAVDSTFGSGSGVADANDPGMTDTGRAVALQSNGDILVAGDSFSSTQNDEFLVTRFTPSGTLDTTFGSSGFARFGLGTAYGIPYAMAVDRTDKIILVGSGSTDSTGQYHQWILVRLNANGTADTSFGTNGEVTLNYNGGQGTGADANAILIQPGSTAAQDKYLVGGSATFLVGAQDVKKFALARFNASGSLDTSFAGGTGYITTRVTASNQATASDEIRALALQSDGKIIGAGQTINSSSRSAFGLARYNSDGTLDTTFGTSGTVIANIASNSQDEINGIAIQRDDKIVTFGETSSPATNDFGDFAIGRFNWDDGSVDTTYGTNGFTDTGFGARDWAVGGAILTGTQVGKALVGGTASLSDYAVARYLGDPPPTTPGTPDLTAASDSGRSNTDNITNDNTPTFTGTCTTGETVVLKVDGNDTSPISRVLCRGGNYSITSAATIADGTHQMTVISRNGSGDSSPSSGLSVTIDTVANPPTISSPTEGSTVLPSPAISGSGAEDQAYVNLYQGPGATNAVSCDTTPTTSDSSGNWSCSSNLGPGSYSIVATQTDVAGNTSSATSARHFTIRAPTTTTLDSSAPSAVYGQSITFTATVSSAFPGTPSGTVDFKNGTTDIPGCDARTLSSGPGGDQATCMISNLAVSATPYTITASYSGDTLFLPSTSSDLSQTVSKADTSVSVSSSENPSVSGDDITFTAQVSATSPGSGTPTGTVTFQDGGSDICTDQALTSGQATCSTSTLSTSGSPHSITAIYGGDDNFNGSTGTLSPDQVVDIPLSVATNPAGQTVDAGTSVSFSASANGTPTPTVQWQRKGVSDADFSDISGATSTTYTFNAAAGDDGAQYRAVFTNIHSEVTTSAATLTVHYAPNVTTDPSDQTVDAGSNASFSAAASGNPMPSVQWQMNDGSGWTDISGATNTTLSLVGVTAAMDGYQYRAVFTNTFSSTDHSAMTNAATLTVHYAPSMTTQPTDQTADVGGTATFTALADGDPSPSVQWQLNDGSGWTDISGATSTSLTLTSVTAGMDGYQYRAVFTNSFDATTHSATSWGATLHVGQPTTTTVTSSANPSVFGQSVTFTATVSRVSGTGTPTGSIQFSIDGSPFGSPVSLNASGQVQSDPIASLSVTNHAVTADYTPSSGTHYKASTGSLSGGQTVNKDTTVTTLSPVTSPKTYGQSITFTATVSVNSPGIGTPTGTVGFYDGASLIGTGTLNKNSPDQATFSTSSLSVGLHTITASYGGDSTSNTSASDSVSFLVQATTSTLYTGMQILNTGSSLSVSAQVTSTPAVGVCTNNPSSAVPAAAPPYVTFTLDSNPLTGAAGSFTILPSTSTTNGAIPVRSGTASLANIGTTGWLEGVYTITATYTGPTGCVTSADTATLTVASPGDAANGGGWYNLAGSGRINFGFVVQKIPNTSPTQYKGQLNLINNGKWKLKGNLTSYSKTSSGQGAASGTGTLSWWNQSLNGGLGDWQPVAANPVAFTISFTGTGSNSKTTPGTFGIHINYTSVSPQPSNLPNSSPQPLKGGSIKVS